MTWDAFHGEGTLGGTADDALVCRAAADGLGQTVDPLATILGTAISAGGQIGGAILTADAQKAALEEQAKAQEASAAAAAQAALDQANLSLEARGQDEQLQAARSAQIAKVAKVGIVAVAALAALGIGAKVFLGRKKV